MSLRHRILVGFVLVAGVLVGSNLALYGTFHSFLLKRLDRQLVAAAQPIAERPPGGRRGGPGGPGGPGGGAPVTPADEEALTEYYIAVARPATGSVSRVGSALAREARPGPRIDIAALEAHTTVRGQPPRPFTAPAESGGRSWRLVAIERAVPAGSVSLVGIDLSELDVTLNRIRLMQTAGTILVLTALAVVSWWMLRLGVHPLAAMARTADAIATGDLSQRVDHPDARTEAGRLGVALNSMLERIEEAFRAREASEETVRRFAADASHELRTPLTSIQGYAELWRAGGLRDEAELTDAMRRMEQEGRRMGALVEDLLLLARLDQHRPMEHKLVRLDIIAADAVSDARAVEPGRPVELSVMPVTVEGDEMRLRQVVANLLTNARIHTPPGTLVHAAVTATDGLARLEVADDGPGLAPEVAAKVFERFYRADPARTRTAGGAGLGLSIVAAIVEAHGGRATVDSRVGAGSSFVIELPAAGSDPAAADGAVTAPEWVEPDLPDSSIAR